MLCARGGGFGVDSGLLGWLLLKRVKLGLNSGYLGKR